MKRTELCVFVCMCDQQGEHRGITQSTNSQSVKIQYNSETKLPVAESIHHCYGQQMAN